MLYGTGKYTYELVDGWMKTPKGIEVIAASGLSIDSQDRIYVINRSAHPVMVFDREGNLLTSWGKGLFTCAHGRHHGAHGISVGTDGYIYCIDDNAHTVTKFTPEGKLLLTLGNKDQPSDTGYVKQPGGVLASLVTIKRGGLPFNCPTDVALSSSGEIYVTDGYGNSRVHKFTPDGTLLFSWGEPGTAPGQFRLPHGVWVDKQERVWVVDRENNRIQIFNAKGEFLKQWNDLSRPTGIFIDDEGTVYVSELNQRISIFTNNGKLLARWDSQGQDRETALLAGPHAVAVDSHGDLYVGEIAWTVGARALQKFARIT